MLIVAQTENLCLMLTVVCFFQNLFNDQTTENTDVGGQDIIMKALNEAGIEPQHDLQGLMKELDDERAKTKQLTGRVKNQYSKLSRLRKNYQNQAMAAENERFHFTQAQKQLNDEKKEIEFLAAIHFLIILFFPSPLVLLCFCRVRGSTEVEFVLLIDDSFFVKSDSIIKG